MEKKLKNVERTEEVQAIIDRMPTRFGYVTTIFILVLLSVFFFLGFTIKYPDVVIGEIIINTNNSPIKLVANTSGRILLNEFKSQQMVSKGDYIAVIDNSANLSDVRKISKILQKIKLKENKDLDKLLEFPRNVSVGELNLKYFNFLNAFMELTNYRNSNIFDKQNSILHKLLFQQKELIKTLYNKLELSSKSLNLMRKFHKRDSILFSKNVITESEHDRSEMNDLAVKEAYQNILSNIAITQGQIEDTENKLQENLLRKNDTEKQIYLNFISSLTDLEDNIKSWEYKYVFKAPIDGRVQFLKFWNNNQFVENNESVFTIIPIESKVLGQMSLPSFGAGKVVVKQEVIVKLDNYPYAEYGVIKGNVSSISLTTKPLVTKNGNFESYLVNVDLPNGLKTNYGKKLTFKYEIKGSAEIITQDRYLIQRLFDNINNTVLR